MPHITETVFVTGASRGIGLAITQHLLEKNYAVVGISNTTPTPIQHDNFENISIDLANLSELPEKLQKIQDRFPQINNLVLCAGRGQFGSLEEFSFNQIEQMMAINFTSHVFIARSFISRFKTNKKGNIVFIGSEAALKGSRKGTIYCASKFAIRGFCQALRDECGKSGVRVSLINPGMTRTTFFDNLSFEPGHDPHQYITPEDVAILTEQILSMRLGTVIDEINLSPLTHVVQPKK